MKNVRTKPNKKQECPYCLNEFKLDTTTTTEQENVKHQVVGVLLLVQCKNCHADFTYFRGFGLSGERIDTFVNMSMQNLLDQKHNGGQGIALEMAKSFIFKEKLLGNLK